MFVYVHSVLQCFDMQMPTYSYISFGVVRKYENKSPKKSALMYFFFFDCLTRDASALTIKHDCFDMRLIGNTSKMTNVRNPQR